MSKWALFIYFIKPATILPHTQDNSTRMAKLYKATKETMEQETQFGIPASVSGSVATQQPHVAKETTV
jgi:hypothetical protein